MGYTGGDQPDPTYYHLGDHTESVEILFNPEQISYQELLDIFWSAHHPDQRPWSRQYMAAIFTHTPEQRRLALASLARVKQRFHGRVFTEILPAKRFYPAEDYHQKYYLRQFPELLREFQSIYPSPTDFRDSTAAARINGYLGGNLPADGSSPDLDRLGLAPAGRRLLARIIDNRHP